MNRENLAGVLVLAFSLLLVLLYTLATPRDPKGVAVAWGSWAGAVFFIALVDSDHLMWLFGRSKKAAVK